jgi:hypothetical protein
VIEFSPEKSHEAVYDLVNVNESIDLPFESVILRFVNDVGVAVSFFVSQKLPVYPSGHVQIPLLLLHVPPFLQVP